jgi:hypothetical protein
MDLSAPLNPTFSPNTRKSVLVKYRAGGDAYVAKTPGMPSLLGQIQKFFV